MKYCKTKNKLISFIRNFWKVFSRPIILYITILAIAILIGILTCSSFTGELKKTHMSDRVFFAFISQTSSMWGLFFNCLLIYSLAFFMGVFFNHGFFTALEMGVIIVFGYLLGFDIVIVVSTFSILSMLLYLIIYVLCKLLIFAILCVVFAISLKRWQESKKFGCIKVDEFMGINLKQVYVGLYVSMVLIIFLFCVLATVFNFTQVT